MGGWIKDLIAGLINEVLDTITHATLTALNWVLGLLSASVFASPDVTVLPQVRYVAGNAQLTANAAMVLVVMVAGIIAMTHGSVQDRYTVKELLPRLVIGFVAANMWTPIVSGAITGANALTGALAGGRFNSADSFGQLRRVIVDTTTDPSQFLMALVLRELGLWMLVLLVITWLGRLAVLLVVAGTAPVALACHALPQTEPVARIWWRALLACLSVQVLQAVTLHMAVATLLVSDANLPALGLPHDPTGLLNMLIAALLLWLVIRIPKWVARNFGGTSARGASMLGSVIRVVVVQQALRAIGLRGRGRAAGRGVRAPTAHLHSHQHAGATHLHDHRHVHVHPPRDGRPGSPYPRPPYRAGDVTPGARPHAGPTPGALEGRRGLSPPPPRRAIGPGN